MLAREVGAGLWDFSPQPVGSALTLAATQLVPELV